MTPPYPIILLTGFLGAGKTTLLNHLLSLPEIRDRKIALVINEFGSLGVDGSLVNPGDYARFELNKGSLFCICVKTDFLKTLETIAGDVRPDLVLIEATGIAETRDLEAFVDEPHLTQHFEIQANLCVVDALNFTKIAPSLRAARSQAIWADGIVVNKTDLVGEHDLAQLLRVLESMNPHAPRTTVSFGRVPAGFISGLKHTKHDAALLNEPPDPIFSLSLEIANPIDRDRLLARLAEHNEHILRMKGYVDFGDGPVYLELINGEVLETLLHAEAPPPFLGLTVIAWKIRQAELEDEFRLALA